MVVGFVIVNMVNIKFPVCIGCIDATKLTGMVIALPDLLFQRIGKFVRIYRTNGVGQPTGHACALCGAIFAQVHIEVQIGLLAAKCYTAILANHFNYLGSLVSNPAFYRAINRFLAQFGKENFIAMFACIADALISPLCITITRAKYMRETLRMIWRSMNQFTANLTWLFPSRVGAFPGAIESLSSLCFVVPRKKFFAAGMTNTLDSPIKAFAPAFSTAKFTLGGRNGIELYTAILASGTHEKASFARGNIRTSTARSNGCEGPLRRGLIKSSQLLNKVYHEFQQIANSGAR